MQHLAFLVTLLAGASAPVTTVPSVDVLIQAGHQGRPASCAYFKHKCNLGTPGEQTDNPIVADEAARVLRAHGVSVARVPADFVGTYDVKAAAFVHFDGAKPCTSGASVGYRSSPSSPASAEDRDAARLWHEIYGRYVPFAFMSDNFTTNLSAYYAFRQVRASEGALVIEFGELTCPSQRAWLEPRLKWNGKLLAYFLSRLIGEGHVPDPGPYSTAK